jgi:hypothetical protein
MIAAAGVALVFAHAVGRADATARLIVSGGAIVFVILMAIAGDLNGSWYHVVTLAGIAALLWLATDARIAFGDTALDASRLQGGRPPVQPQSPPAPYEKPAAQPGEPPVV